MPRPKVGKNAGGVSRRGAAVVNSEDRPVPPVEGAARVARIEMRLIHGRMVPVKVCTPSLDISSRWDMMTAKPIVKGKGNGG